MRILPFQKERREREARDHFTTTEPELFALNVNPNTGEVVEEARWRTMNARFLSLKYVMCTPQDFFDS